MISVISVFAALVLGSTIATGAEYGVDCSFPIHSTDLKCGDLLGDRMAVYEEYMQGCRDFYGRKGRRCDSTEKDRLAMSLRQPQSMVNYTSTGFMKIRAPKAVQDLLFNHWETNNHLREKEDWGVGNVYSNHWVSPTYMVSVENTKLRGAGSRLKEKIWDAAKSTIEQWTGMELRPTSMYGIRVYTEGAILSPHVDRLPLVSSCIINVAQDVDEDWPLEVIDRFGNAVNVTMEPGDMVLYESGSLIHARPFALKGRYFANIFIHFEPTGRPLNDHTDEYLKTLDSFYPPYLMPNSPELPAWRASNPHGWNRPSPSAPIQQVVSPEAHRAAANGDADRLHEIAKTNPKALHFKDSNGWQPIHEAVRSGYVDAVDALLQHGADINARTGKGDGSSPLNMALSLFDEGHEVTQLLISRGAENLFSEL